MNATPMNFNPAASAQAATASKPQDADAPEVPFSQVLSKEMAHGRKDSPVQAAPASPREAETESQAAAGTAGTASPDQAAAPEEAAREEAARAAQTPDAAAPVLPDALIALALPAERPQAVPVEVPVATAEATPAGAAMVAPAPDSRKGRVQQQLQRGPFSLEAADAQQSARALPGKTDAQATAAPATSGTTAAPAFSGQLAAAMQADSVKAGEIPAELLNHPLLRSAPQAALDAAADKLAPSVGSAAWGQALGEKIVWMAAGSQQTASLTLNPPNLGPLHVVLNLSNDQATASFFSAQPEVRQALETAFPKLREMMNEAGIQLGQATVSADTPSQQQAFAERQPQRLAIPFGGAGETAAADMPGVAQPAAQSGRGLVDTFA